MLNRSDVLTENNFRNVNICTEFRTAVDQKITINRKTAIKY